MDTNKNSYTIIYATVLVVFVAALLAFVSSSLKERQQKNVEVEKQLSLLGSVGLGADAASAQNKTAYIESEFSKYIKKGIVVNAAGDVVSEAVNTESNQGAVVGGEAFKIDLKTQFDLMKKIAAAPSDKVSALEAEVELPVFVCELPSHEEVYLFSCYGAGLWGPIWGYIAVKTDFSTVYGAVFSHKSETPGLGAEIATAKFCDQFKGKEIFNGNDLTSINIVKGGAQAGNIHDVDAISGGTITSVALENTLRKWLDNYLPYIDKMRVLAATPMPIDEQPIEEGVTETIVITE